MKFIKAALIVFAATLSANALAQSAYSKVEIRLDEAHTTKALGMLGIDVSHGILKKGSFVADLSAEEIADVKNAGFTCTILIDDVQAYYTNRSATKSGERAVSCGEGPNVVVPNGFELGSMGGFFTYEEFLAHLDTMAARYPNLISVKAPIGSYQSIQGRSIYWLKISDNPNQNETAEPQVLYTAVHHAREPLGLSQLIFYMYFLLENYNTNPYVKYIVDNTELYFVPMINPDGYIYNQTTEPNGGGMWRKNRRNNGNGTMGVDLNRNYDFEWGTTGTTTTDGNAETYCGTAPFSEPETQAMKWFIEEHEFALALNYHTYSNLLLYPWGHSTALQCPDNDNFIAIANNMASHTELFVQQSSALYEASGSSDDWAYGDVTNKPKVFAMTPELGSQDDGFWPQEDRIIPVSKEQLGMNMKMAYTAGNYAVASDLSPIIITNTNGYFKYNLQRLGLQAGNFTVSINPLTNMQSTGAANTHNGLTLIQTVTDSISYTLSPTIHNGDQVRFVLEVDNGLVVLRDTITKLYGNAAVAFNSSGAPINQWTTTGGFGLSNDTYFTSPNSLADSPNGDYANNNTATATTANTIDLTNVSNAYLRFKARWDIELGYDYAQVSASVDGQSWTPLCGKYTHPGNINQDFEMPLYDGIQEGWVDEEINLAGFVGMPIYIRFSRVADQFETGDGIFIDDVIVETIATVGMEETAVGNIKLFPNPATNSLTIATEKEVNYTVYDIVGKQLLSGNATGNTTLDIAALSKGLYFIQLSIDGKQAVVKFVKE